MMNKTRENHRFSVSRKFVKFSRKSQAALEFIMTYGWAILVVLVAIGALAYFGVLSPDKFLPSKCTLQSGIACTDFKVTATSLVMYVQNSLGRDVTIDRATANGCTDLGSQGTVANGAAKQLTFCCGAACAPVSAGNSGSKYNGAVNVTYTVTDTGIQHINQGSVTGRIE